MTMPKPDWEGFCRDILEEWPWPTRDVDGVELFNLCIKHHMIREVPGGFKEGQHIDADCICPEEGDPWYEYNFPFKKAGGIRDE
jgi:hypothetical protein